jgi:iron complex outermembrane receptor protein
MLQADPPFFLRIAGNPALVPEEALGVEIGYRQLVAPTFSVDVAAFRTSYDGLLSFGAPAVTAETAPIEHLLLTFPYVNGMSGTASGLEIAPTWQAGARWTVRGGYSYLRMDLENTGASEDTTAVAVTEGSSPRHQLFVQSTLTAGRLEIVPAYRYIARLPAQPAEAVHALDLRLGWRVRPDLELAVTGRDLLDEEHVEFDHPAGSPPVAIRRSVTVSLQWRP